MNSAGMNTTSICSASISTTLTAPSGPSSCSRRCAPVRSCRSCSRISGSMTLLKNMKNKKTIAATIAQTAIRSPVRELRGVSLLSMALSSRAGSGCLPARPPRPAPDRASFVYKGLYQRRTNCTRLNPGSAGLSCLSLPKEKATRWTAFLLVIDCCFDKKGQSLNIASLFFLLIK